MRKSDYPIVDLLLQRRSLRAMRPQIADEDLNALFEAARWAPSCFNSQPWYFLLAKHQTKNFATFFSLLADGNKKRGAKMQLYCSLCFLKKTFQTGKLQGQPDVSHSFCSGMAYENMALEGWHRNIVVHAMRGFDEERARLELHVPATMSIEAMIAIGSKGSLDELDKSFVEAEKNPTKRQKIAEFVKEGLFS